jgi:hypothetical protein
MFFLGGINSIIPYILYLSLIWVFLIIGFGSRILPLVQNLTPKIFHTDYHSLQHLDNKITEYYHYTDHEVKPKTVIADVPVNCKYFLPVILEDYSPGNSVPSQFSSCPVSSTGFRGPPIL